jgi:beta-lactam-binding protein with PASTA domain
MKSGLVRVVGVAAVAVFVLVLVGCGGSGTPDTEGQTLAQAQQTLRDAGYRTAILL